MKPDAYDLHDRFHYHAPSPDGIAIHHRLSLDFENLAQKMTAICPESARPFDVLAGQGSSPDLGQVCP